MQQSAVLLEDRAGPVPVAVNFHLFKPCNLRCRFCFATFRDVRGRLPTSDARRLIHLLAAAGAEKLTFVGGEPTLHPDIGELVECARAAGLVTCVVTNGARLDPLLEAHGTALDWVGLSVDSADEQVQARLGRGDGDHVGQALRLADRCRGLGIRLKLNTVVTALNVDEDMTEMVLRFAPQRWKVFQVLPVDGQNDGTVEDLLVEDEAFRRFVERHRRLAEFGIAPIAEQNELMRGSYVMVDPLGRLFDNAAGSHRYSQPILEVGVEAALAQVYWSRTRFDARGGLYDWRPATAAPTVSSGMAGRRR